MRARSDYCMALCLVVSTLCACSRSKRIDVTSAQAFVGDYASAVQSRDSVRVAAFWSERSRRRDDFWTMHFKIGSLIPFQDMGRRLESDLTFEIDDFTNADDYAIVCLLKMSSALPLLELR